MLLSEVLNSAVILTNMALILNLEVAERDSQVSGPKLVPLVPGNP
jgi:hypothetical protein